MSDFLKLVALASFVTLGNAAIAQETTTPKPQTDATADAETTTGGAADNPMDLSMGEEVVEEKGPGTTYVHDRFNDWELRCVRVEEGQKEPCNLFQLMKDEQGTAIAEISFIILPKGQQAAAGATIVAPLETLLTQQLTLSVDEGTKKRYPFRFCTPIGCYAQVGFSNGDVAAFKRGVAAALTIVPAFAPEEKITVKLSLAGFTKAYEALQALSPE
ncbi:MAG: invasion associated locus B family protein [Marinosulfonomonas sp.]|nr:invasion associated locus B family protein [Marinosulfonomonas sp.]